MGNTNTTIAGQLLIWYQAVRPRSLTATYVPVALGGVMAWEDDKFHIARFALALLGVLFLQISANLINEYFDYTKGMDAQKTHGLGMILARGLLTPRQVAIAGSMTLLAGAVVGLYFVAITGPLVLIIGIGGVLVVVFYTAGPYPLAYIGLGEIAVFIFMGPLIVLGIYYVLAETLALKTIWASLPIACLVAAILHANNLRDLEADATQNKHTLATIFGRSFAQAEYVLLTGGAFVCTLALVILGIAPVLTLASAILVGQEWRLIQIATSSTNPGELHVVLVGTAELHRRFGVIYVLAWILNHLL
jgi:1,4-dihydroxy-2-naphthoate octaprenyltransferase